MLEPQPGRKLFSVLEDFQVFSPYNRGKKLRVAKDLTSEVWADAETPGEDVRVWVNDRDLRADRSAFTISTKLKDPV
jgi:hypothetical protein